jgi:hypothetical protein
LERMAWFMFFSVCRILVCLREDRWESGIDGADAIWSGLRV